jgi:hypothetical protein
LYPKDNITLGEGRGTTFIMFLEKGKEEKIAEMLKTPNNNPEPSEEAIPEGQAVCCESRWKKMIGKPYSGELNVRFDEGELEIGNE